MYICHIQKPYIGLLPYFIINIFISYQNNTHSEFFSIILHVSTNATTQGVLFTVRRVIYFQRTIFSFTLWQLISCFSGNVVATTLFLMAWLTEMCITPAEPLCNRAAKLTFVFNEFHSMSFAIFNTTTHTDGGTFSTYQLFLLEILIIILSRFAVLHSSKVWVIAFKALVIGESLHSEAMQIIIKLIPFFLQSWILM